MQKEPFPHSPFPAHYAFLTTIVTQKTSSFICAKISPSILRISVLQIKSPRPLPFRSVLLLPR